MELYLDSAKLSEIEPAFQLGFVKGLTTTPTFMHRDGVTDIDGLLLKLSKIVPILQIEALGQTADDIVKEAYRQIEMGLSVDKTVFKIPVSLEGLKACRKLRDQNLMVNVHLVYTVQQAYMAMEAGANFVCPLVGRLQDQGHDALYLVEQCVKAVEKYDYKTKIMFSSVRNAEHVKNAINLGVHTITVPWKVMKVLTENNFAKLGTDQFFEHVRLMTVQVKDAVRKKNPVVSKETPINEALVKMTEFGFGAVSVVNESQDLVGIFTDGNLRRLLQHEGGGVLDKKLKDLDLRKPICVEEDELLTNASKIITDNKVDSLVVTKTGKPTGMLDIQDIKGVNKGLNE